MASPGDLPILAKLVSQIIAEKFVEISDLLSMNILLAEPKPKVLFNDRLVLTSAPKRPKRRIGCLDGGVFCLHVFDVFLSKSMAGFVAAANQLLILRTHPQFSGHMWLVRDRAFQERAAASDLVNWSSINIQ